MTKDYQLGKIYCIRTYQSNEVYVGSTIQTLSNRMGGHRRDFKAYKKGTNTKYVSSFEILKYTDCYIELVKLNPCNSKTELDREEGKYIRQMDCVNKNIPGRTKAQYRIENKDKISAKMKEYYIDNKASITEYRKTHKFICKCGGNYRIDNKPRHFRSTKHKLYLTMKQAKPKPKLTKITDYYKPLVNSPVILVI